MNTITKLPTQQELDLCTSMYDKFKLKPPELCYDLNERDFSRLFAEVTRPYLRYNTSILKWMYYNGRYWETDASGVNVQRCMKEFSFELLKYATNEIGMANEEFLEYVKEQGKLPVCLTMSLAAYIAFYSNEIQDLTDAGLVCKRPAGNEYIVSDDRWVLEFYYAHREDSEEALVHAVLTNEKMWEQDLTKIEELEKAVVEDLVKIRKEGAKAAYESCL